MSEYDDIMASLPANSYYDRESQKLKETDRGSCTPTSQPNTCDVYLCVAILTVKHIIMMTECRANENEREKHDTPTRTCTK